MFNTQIRSLLMTECNKIPGSHSHSKPLRIVISSVCPGSLWIEGGGIWFFKKNQFGHLSKMEKRESKRNISRGIIALLWEMRDLDECLGWQGLVPQVSYPTSRVGTGSKCGSCKFCDCAALCPGTSWEGAVQPLSFSPSLPPCPCSPPPYAAHCSGTGSVRSSTSPDTWGGERHSFRADPTLNCSAVLWSYVIHGLKSEIWVCCTLDSSWSPSGFGACVCHCFQILWALW